MVMIRSEKGTINSISVSDPSRLLGKIHLAVSVKIEKKGDSFASSWNEQEEVSHIAIDLPAGVSEGKSVSIDLLK